MRKDEKLSEVYETLEELLKLVLIIDIFNLKKLMEKTSEVKEIIRKKDVIIFIGKTGGGKTTLILKFLGNNF